MKKEIFKTYFQVKYRIIYSFHYRFKKSCVLEKNLAEKNQNKWLDIGSSTSHNNMNFFFADLYPIEECPPKMKSRYYQLDISKPISDKNLIEIGKFDFIRMQHVFEHFTYEEADIVLSNCHKLLHKKGRLLITVPDLDIFIKRYKTKTLKYNSKFKLWATQRIKENASDSDYFSIFTHSLLSQPHFWCYNKIGLIEKINSVGLFKDIFKIGLLHNLANIPFTHNRPEEDLCILCTVK